MHLPATPTSCNISDIINEMSFFVANNPMWDSDPDMIKKMSVAYSILTSICEPIHLTDDEFEFVMDIFETCKGHRK